MPRLEFVGGPRDGEFFNLHESNEVHVCLDRMPGPAMIVDEVGALSMHEPRIGVYRKVRRRDGDYLKWMGERE